MANADLAWLKWYPARAQNSLRWLSLSLEERGLFHELYDLAALANPRGALVAPNGCDLDMLLSVRLRLEAADYRRILGALVARGLIVENEAQSLVFPDFATHQRNAPARVRRKSGAKVARKRRKSGTTEEEEEEEVERELERENRKTSSPAAPSAFDAFWKAYPRKTGKKAARRAWDKAKDKPALDVLLKTLEAQKASHQWKRDGGQFIPHPQTWLNQGRWDDDVESEPKGGRYDEQGRPKRDVHSGDYKTPEYVGDW